MKTLRFNCLIAAVALAATPGLASANDKPLDNAGAARARMAEPDRQREEPVAVVVDGLPPDVARAIKRRAALGRTFLIMYLDRGRFIYETRREHVARTQND